MKVIVGLGNPGKRYEKTRHNAGFLVLDELQKMPNMNAWTLSKKFNAEISEGSLMHESIVLVKPMTFMNNSGQSVGLIMQYYKLDPTKDLMVLHDDKDITLGTMKVQKDRSAAGHNGIKSIIEHLGTQNFSRIRLGIASEHQRQMEDTATFVLGKFSLFEKRAIKKMAEDAQKHITDWIT
ncbi:MAG: aminoacyl-tRNA hydrolase [Candidatus Magasanikbacteria bacterium CG_4_9_14_0_2_um_filter_41_10]|uniref:Peptidyl-tRNA hydrolase n=1 Tax=Candidatus Magasanikbacteria bacterium CG_4_10_14_0_2_um_filter_41_31 TaxID=1974639 RepID=A0A2M7V4X5_9BACT|nr:MAG: aminoacyl-tRNA hydrolase [Candidatus Magasanikbacteria bacterium CG1_02_41_34]PIZ93542.1 MAG: aminoacyl-tRNA hydrolase [Candidatus Magasanikbacteria bacterium CG_4_10_14_0_2_um_filter_41_31]PJC53330.1 MAG: aminoacyl-tRNA hydrolase [Candidatus Magasanikbacteria bacterium CG_4_9_14_0_2_um_filter_41_10]